MKVSVIAFTKNGCILCKKLNDALQMASYDSTAYSLQQYASESGLAAISGSLSEWTKRQFEEVDGIVYIGATGIAVRSIAPFLKSKTVDPAVVVLDELGQFVIPLLSGHIGGANELAIKIADLMQATPVITTATDLNNQFAVDVFAVKNHLYIARMDLAKNISAAVLRQEEIGFDSELEVMGELPPALVRDADCKLGIFISEQEVKQPFEQTLHLIPQRIFVGFGCRKAKPLAEIEEFVLETLEKHGISIHAVAKVATIDLKKQEAGLLQFCEHYHLPLEFFSAEELKEQPGEFEESDYVQTVTGIGNVCERAALAVSNQGRIILHKTAKNGMTISLARKEGSVCFE